MTIVNYDTPPFYCLLSIVIYVYTYFTSSKINYIDNQLFISYWYKYELSKAQKYKIIQLFCFLIGCVISVLCRSLLILFIFSELLLYHVKAFFQIFYRRKFVFYFNSFVSSRPLKSPFLRDIVQVQYLAYFLKHAQKSFHSSFEVICCCREKYVHSISYHTLIKVAAQTIIRL